MIAFFLQTTRTAEKRMATSVTGVEVIKRVIARHPAGSSRVGLSGKRQEARYEI